MNYSTKHFPMFMNSYWHDNNFLLSIFQFKKPKGPSKKVPRRQKSLSVIPDSYHSHEQSQMLTQSLKDTESSDTVQTSYTVQNDINNNAQKDNQSNGSDKENQIDSNSQIAQSPVPRLDLERLDKWSASARRRDKHKEEEQTPEPPSGECAAA